MSAVTALKTRTGREYRPENTDPAVAHSPDKNPASDSFLTGYSYCQAQQVEPGSAVYAVNVTTPGGNSLLNVFIDCKRCDGDFLKKEITFISYVRDRHEAQAHILITTQTPASGGMEYTLEFIGQERFSGINDTLKLAAGPLDTADINRNKLAKAIKTGLSVMSRKLPLWITSQSHTAARKLWRL